MTAANQNNYDPVALLVATACTACLQSFSEDKLEDAASALHFAATALSNLDDPDVKARGITLVNAIAEFIQIINLDRRRAAGTMGQI